MKIKAVFTIKIVLIIIYSFSSMTINGQDLKKHQWENRLVIVKTSDIKSQKYQDQLKEFKNSNEDMSDRKFVLYQITANDFELIDYKNSNLNTSGKISEKFRAQMLNDKDDFEVILIGLDGEIKLQQTELLKKEELYDIVDGMVMRKNELRRNATKN